MVKRATRSMINAVLGTGASVDLFRHVCLSRDKNPSLIMEEQMKFNFLQKREGLEYVSKAEQTTF